MEKNRLSRRHIIQTGLALSLTSSAGSAFGGIETMPLTPACGVDSKLTQPQTPGPFFTPDTPLRNDFRGDGSGGQEMTVSGFVTDQQCRPLANAQVELWHAGPDGRYDNQGFKFRGHSFTDDKGRYDFATLVPGLYPGRTRHFHVKIRPVDGPWLTSQLYFPGESANNVDGIFDKHLIMAISQAGTLIRARFDFVVRA
ncbi:MAG: hypothetical protein JKX94_09595 [Sneathiella sp.]|nr:hypothetical protein [Sneathiella sp.]